MTQPDVALRVGGHEALVPRRDADRRHGSRHRVEDVDLAKQSQARILRGPHAEPGGHAALLVAEDHRLASEQEGDRRHRARVLRLDRHEICGRDRSLAVDAHREEGSRDRRGDGFLPRLADGDPADPRPVEARGEVLDGGYRRLGPRKGVLLFLRQLDRHEVGAARRGENQVPPILPGGGDLSDRRPGGKDLRLAGQTRVERRGPSPGAELDAQARREDGGASVLEAEGEIVAAGDTADGRDPAPFGPGGGKGPDHAPRLAVDFLEDARGSKDDERDAVGVGEHGQDRIRSLRREAHVAGEQALRALPDRHGFRADQNQDEKDRDDDSDPAADDRPARDPVRALDPSPALLELARQPRGTGLEAILTQRLHESSSTSSPGRLGPAARRPPARSDGNEATADGAAPRRRSSTGSGNSRP